MNTLQEEALEEMKTEIYKWFDEQEKLDNLDASPLIDYRFNLKGAFATKDGPVKITMLESVSEDKKQQLLERIQSYIEKTGEGFIPNKAVGNLFFDASSAGFEFVSRTGSRKAECCI